MQEKITQRTLGRLDGSGVRYFIWDSALTGFGIEVSAKGKASYVCETRIKGTGKKVRRKIGSVDLLPLDDARQTARTTLLQASKGIDPRFDAKVKQEGPASVGQAVSDYIEAKRHKLAPSTLRDYRVTFSSCLSDWEHLPVAQLTGPMVALKYNSLLETRSAAYCNKVMRNLKAALNFHNVEPNPVKFLSQKDLLAESNARERFLSAYEIYTVYEHFFTFHDQVARVVLFVILTGVRKNEAFKLKWKDVTSHTIEFRGDIQKNHKPHYVPRVGLLNTILGDRSEQDNLVFGYTQNSFRKKFERSKARKELSGWPYWTIDLPRDFSSTVD